MPEQRPLRLPFLREARRRLWRIACGRRRVSRWHFLAEASAVLDSALDYEETIRRVCSLAVPAVADYFVVLVLDDHGVPEFSAIEARDPEKKELIRKLAPYRESFIAIPEHPVAMALRTCLPQHYEMTDELLRRFSINDEVYRITQAIAPAVWDIVPLAVHGRVFGFLSFGTVQDSGRLFQREDEALGRELARRAAHAIAHARMYAEERRAVQDREEVVAIVSHDLKDPLSTVRAALDMALEERLTGENADPALRKPLIIARDATERMLRLVRDLLDFTKLHAGQFDVDVSPEKPAEIVHAAITQLKPIADKRGVTLTTEVRPELPDVLVDRDRIAQVLSNLIGNATKFTPAGGHVVVRAAQQDGVIRFAVEDTGEGIAPDHLPHLFDRYWHAGRGTQSGSGLGLAIAKGIVEAHGGTLQVESRLGHGSTFSFTARQARRPSPSGEGGAET